MPSQSANGLSSYPNFETPPPIAASNGVRIKAEPGTESQYNAMSNGYPHANSAAQGGLARAQQLVQQQYGPNASASLSAMQRAGGGLALPGQQQQPQQTQMKPQGLHLPGQAGSLPVQPMSAQQAAMMRHQQQQLLQQQQQQQQGQPRIKVENDSPQLAQTSFQQQPIQPNYSQTDGADEALEQWQAMLAERRAISVEQREAADRMMRDQIVQISADLQSGLMMPLDEQPSIKKQKRRHRTVASSSVVPSSHLPTIPQLDGEVDEEDRKPEIKDEDDENAINSDLDDSDEEDRAQLGDDDDDYGDQILCTYDKVQRVKNKWKCVLKDGIMSAKGKEWVFHKGTGEFEW